MIRIVITAHRTAEFLTEPSRPAASPLEPNRIRAKTLVSLVSAGTELNAGFLSQEGFPKHPGYAGVLEVLEVGSEVKGLQPGDRVFSCTGHSSLVECAAIEVCRLPDGLAPESAVFARLMGVGMSTLNTAAAHPPSRVLVTGLGVVGQLAAQVFQRCGYRVTASDPDESRCRTARDLGLKDVRTRLGEQAEDLKGTIGLHLECAGHEAAVLDGCNLLRTKGECVLVGVPWGKRVDLQSFDLLHAVFHKYITLRGGWEWEIPRQPQGFTLHSITENYSAALDWLAEGSVQVEGLATLYSPSDCQMVYEGLLAQSLKTPAVIFDWRELS